MSTRTPIASQKVISGTTSVTFSNIPQTFSDLVLVCNVKGTNATDSLNMTVNNDTGNNYSIIRMQGISSAESPAYGSQSSFAIGDFMPNSGNFFAPTIVHINRYSNPTIWKTILSRNGIATNWVTNIAGLWRNTSAINTITIRMGASTNIQTDSTFDLYGIVSGGGYANGGDIVKTDGTYWYHVFLSSGAFTPTQNLTNVDYLVVAGGGGSGNDNSGGGGAGGLRSTVTATGGGGSLESKLSLTANTVYPVLIGAGGYGATTSGAKGSNGFNSSFGSIQSIGGGGGGGDQGGARLGLTGGSGGGGTGNNASPSNWAGGSETANQGYAGGTGYGSSGGGWLNHRGGGGGGAGAAGVNGNVSSTGGNGGVGVQITALATPTGTGASGYYAGGGAGGTQSTTPSTGGTGGGGNGGSGNPGSGGTSATANTGGGGGGGGGSGGNGANGGSGIVIVRYAV